MDPTSHSRSEEVIAGKLKLLSSIEDEICKHEAQIAILCAEKHRLQSEIAVLRAPWSPIRKLPVEVLTCIFEEFLHDDSRKERTPTASCRKIPNLMLVCKAWNTVVVGTPKLWSRIYIEPEYLKSGLTRGMKRELQYFKTCLKRSRGVQLEIALYLNSMESGVYYMYESSLSGFGEFETQETRQWFSELDWHDCPAIEQYNELWVDFFTSLVGAEDQTMSRWKVLYLAFPYDDTLATGVFRALDNVAPQLRELEIESWVDFEGDLAQHSFGSLDSLERLKLEGNIPPRGFSRCKSIRTLELVRIQDWSWLHHLDHLRGLSSLRLQCSWKGPEITIVDIVLPHLRNLHLCGYIPLNIIQSFRCSRFSTLIVEGDNPGMIGWTPYPNADVFKVPKFVAILMFPSDKEGNGDRTTILSNITSLLDQLSAANTIGFRADLAQDILLSVMACREKGGLSALRSMVIVDEHGDIIREHTSFPPIAIHSE